MKVAVHVTGHMEVAVKEEEGHMVIVVNVEISHMKVPVKQKQEIWQEQFMKQQVIRQKLL